MNVITNRQLVYCLVFLTTALLVFELTPLDTLVQNFFFDKNANLWIWNKSEPIGRLFFYDGPKRLLIVFELGLAAALGWSYYSGQYSHLRSGIRVATLSIIFVPLIVASLKAVTNVACPKDILLYGGSLPLVDVFQHYPLGERPGTMQRCFPAGHASGFFALMALSYCFASPRSKAITVGLAVSIGWAVGIYKMMIGDHFLSHTVISMLIAWMVMCLIHMIDESVSNRLVRTGNEPPINDLVGDESA